MGTRIDETCYSTGIVETRRYYNGPNLHREDGPAYESFYMTGAIESRIWRKGSKLHRLDGPAVESYGLDGDMVGISYHIDGERVLEHEHRRRVVLLKLSVQATANQEVLL